MTLAEAVAWLKTSQATVQFGCFKDPKTGQLVIRAHQGTCEGRGPELEDAVAGLVESLAAYKAKQASP